MSGQDSHGLVSQLKDLAIELGRTPSRDEFDARFGAKRSYSVVFGSYSLMVQAAGLSSPRARKIDNSIFERNLDNHLESYKPRDRKEPENLPTLAIISDIHWPFCSQRVIDKFYKYVEENKPDYVVINGDAWDMYSHSKYPRSHNVFTPRDEQRLAREANELFWKEIKKRSAASKCFQLLGNHDVRPLRRILESYPEAEDWIEQKMRELFSYDGVTTIHDPREELKPDPHTLVFHGYRGKLGDHRDYTLMNCFNGHTHLGGAVYRNIRDMVLFECNSGYAGDPESKGLAYTTQKATKSTPGFAARDKWGARFIPA